MKSQDTWVAFFIDRPVGTTLLALGFGFFGFIAFLFLPVAPLPQIEFPSIAVSATFPGASPETMASAVAGPLEKYLGRIAGVKEMTSSSKLGSMRIVVQFDLDRPINGAARDVQAAILAARTELPSTLPAQPSYKIINPADTPIMVITLTSALYDQGKLYDIASSLLQQKFSQVDGVGQVIVGGGSLPAVRIELNPDQLYSYGLSFDAIQQTLVKATPHSPKGYIMDKDQSWEMRMNDQLFKKEAYTPLILKYHNHTPVRVQDVGEVLEATEDIRTAGISDGEPSVVLIIYKQPGSNIIETIDRLYTSLETIKKAIPAAVMLTVTLDRTETIRTSLKHVEITLLISILLVIGVMYIFLGNARIASISSVVVPLTLFMTFGVMYLCGFSLDNLSLMALTISTGFVVDDAVVILENIQRHMDQRRPPLQAALLGAQEVGFTVLSMSLSLIAVFIPLLLMGGIVGRLFREFALTLSMAILISLIISMTLTPMMSAYLLLPHPLEKRGLSFSEKVGTWLEIHYKRSLQWALRHQKLLLGIVAGSIFLNLILFMIIPKDFFPLQDTGRIYCSIQTQQDMSFSALQKKIDFFVTTIRQDPAVAHVAGYIGGGNAIGNSGALFVSLKPRSERDASVFAVINRLRQKFSDVPSVTVYMQAAQDIVMGGRPANALYQYTLSSYDLPTLTEWAPRIQEELSKIPGLIDVNSDQMNHGLETHLTYDKASLARWGLSAQDVDTFLYSAFGQRQIITLYTPMNQYHVVMEVAPRYWKNPHILRTLFVTNAQGKGIPLSTVASFTTSPTLLTVNHQSQFPSATLSFNILPGFTLGDLVTTITKTVEKLPIPSSKLQGTFQGTAQTFQNSLASEPYLILGALFVIYIVLGILYESLIHPLTILSTLPSAGIGALLALWMVRLNFSIVSLIGFLLLIGIVKKNAIMMIDFALTLQRQKKKSSLAAIYQACLLRFRPILMTTLAALLGALPLAFESGVGSELRKPLGVSILGGLILSQMLTLYTTPVIYLALERIRRAPSP